MCVQLVLAGLAAAVVGFALVVLYILIKSEKQTGGLVESEKEFVDPSGAKHAFPPVAFAPASKADDIYLSVVLPAYNEEKRIGKCFDEMLPYLIDREKRDKSFTWEVVVADDGSKDKTGEVVWQYARQYNADLKVRWLKLAKNRGKGGAVKRGALASRGKYILMADADGATKFPDLEKLETSMRKIEKDGLGIVVGSRAHLETEAVANRTFLRNLAMWGFHMLVRVVGGIHSIKDTQCGFKLFSRKAAAHLFPNLHIERWCFDIELLFVAAGFKLPVDEVAVNWEEIDGSKLNVIDASFQMAWDLLRIRVNYTFRNWSAKKPIKTE